MLTKPARRNAELAVEVRVWRPAASSCVMPRGRRAELKECVVRCSCGVPCVTAGGTPPAISLVTTHYAEPFGWLKPVLSRHERLDVVIYERCSSLNALSLAAAHRSRGPLRAALESPRCADAIRRVGGYACSSALRALGQRTLWRPLLSAHQSTPRVASADRPPGRRLWLWSAHDQILDVDTGAESARCPLRCAPTRACGCATRAARWRSATRSSASSTTWSRATARQSVETRRRCSTPTPAGFRTGGHWAHAGQCGPVWPRYE